MDEEIGGREARHQEQSILIAQPSGQTIYVWCRMISLRRSPHSDLDASTRKPSNFRTDHGDRFQNLTVGVTEAGSCHCSYVVQ